MIRVFGCITEQHDIRLVLLAAVMCFLSGYTALSLLSRVRTDGAHFFRWLAAAATVAGAGVWSTHFVAMLAYRTWFIAGYDGPFTFLSIIIAIVALGSSFYLALRLQAWALGGALFGLGVGAMHYTGMAALIAPAHFDWDMSYVLASLVVGSVLGAAGFHLFSRRAVLGWRLAGALALTLAIAGLHFTGMSALTLQPAPNVIPGASVLLAPDWLAVAIAVVMLMVITLGLSGVTFDEHLAERAIAEADRLRTHVAELEQTRAELQVTTHNLERALTAAAAGSQAKSQFLATMSHELRTPLNAIIGFSEIIAMEVHGPVGEPRYKTYIKDVHDAGRHLLQLVNEILDFSRADYGHIELDEHLVDIQETITSAVRMVTGQFEKAGVALYTTVDPDLPLLRADERRIRQILLNLLSNAAKFTPAGGKVHVMGLANTLGLTLVVEDTGIGIAPDQIAVALEPFGQVDSKLNRKYEGAGLGLPLAKKLVELHEGTLELVSTVNVGTRITVRFPHHRTFEERVYA